MSIEGLGRRAPKPGWVSPHPRLGLGIGRCGNITLLTHPVLLRSSHYKMAEIQRSAKMKAQSKELCYLTGQII